MWDQDAPLSKLIINSVFTNLVDRSWDSNLLDLIRYLRDQFTNESLDFQHRLRCHIISLDLPFPEFLIILLGELLEPDELIKITEVIDSADYSQEHCLTTTYYFNLLALLKGSPFHDPKVFSHMMQQDLTSSRSPDTQKTFQALFKILGKQLSAPECKSSNPPLMPMTLMEYPEDVINALAKLFTKFIKVNSKAPLFQQRNCIVFFSNLSSEFIKIEKLQLF